MSNLNDLSLKKWTDSEKAFGFQREDILDYIGAPEDKAKLPRPDILRSLMESVSFAYARQFLSSCDLAYGSVGSPIESLFFTAIAKIAMVDLLSPDWLRIQACTNGHKETPPSYGLSICLQCSIAGARVDFVLRGGSQPGDEQLEPLPQVIVECDGHDFHERTKEQAKRDRSRDRAFQNLGYKVFRYTGSEIFNDPFSCAREAYFTAVYGKC
jgi:very-short-patch-repair endonuclease